MLTKDLNIILNEILKGNVVSVPTDTIYGLSCKVSRDAVLKLVNLKNRDSSKGFIIISHDYSHLLKYLDIEQLSNQHINKILSKYDQPTTWVAPVKKGFQWLTGGKDTIAIRLVKNDIVTYLCQNIDDAIVSTSANISGKDFLHNAKSISETFDDVCVLDTEFTATQPSLIIDIISGKRYR